jgi:prepilin peptidase CpaA
MAAIGAWFGPWMTFYSFALGVGIGGVIAMVMIVGSGRFRMAMTNLQIIMCKMSSRRTAFGEFGSAHSFGDTSQLLPYGVPLTIGSLIVMTVYVCQGWV